MMRVRAAVIPLALWLVSLAAHASDDPLTNRGINLSGVYHVGDIDTVNLFNGNLIIDVPMATQFPLNGGFSYGIHLIYTGQPWDFPESLRFDDFLQDWVYRAAPIPNRRSNAGMGWRVSIGRLISPGDPTNMDCDQGNFFIGSCAEWVYESPDGAEHRIGSSEPGYSADGTYLRLKSHTEGNIVTYREIEFPDGMIHRFDIDGNLTAIYTPFDRAANGGPSVTVDYLTGASSCGAGADSCWKIHDLFDRTQYVTFASTADAIYGHQLAQKIIVTAPGSSTVTYSLGYTEVPTLSLDAMSCYHGLGGVGPGRWDDISSYSVPLLTSIGLPDQSDYEIAYFNDDPPQCSQGSLRTLTLPTKGSIGYTYTNWAHNNLLSTIDGPGHGAPYVPGVYSRTKTPAGGGTAQVWSYVSEGQDGALIPCGGCQNPSSEWRERRVTLTDPDQRKVRHYFSIADFPDEGWQLREYGLPLTHRSGTATTDPVHTSEPRYLSSEVLDASGNVERSTYVKYDYEAEDTTERPGAFYREQASLTRFANGTGHDAGRWSSVNRSSFDYFGHYRQTETDGNFASELSTQLDHRVELTDYNPGKSGFDGWPVASPWVLNTFDLQWVNTPKINPNNPDSIEVAHTKKTEFCFDGATGFLQRRRVLWKDAATADGVAEDGADQIAVFTGTSDNSGNLFSEQYYGGENAGLPLGALCGLDFSDFTPRYDIRHTAYQNGVRATSQYYSHSTNALMPFKTLDRTIDLSGSVSRERDVAGVETTYSPDSSDPLRIKTVKTTGIDQITYTYSNASVSGSSFTPAEIQVSQNDVASRVQYDSFGRMWREFRTMPGIGEVTRETLYDSSNRKLSQSMWDSSSYANKTAFEYDFLGRLDKVTQPDGTFVTTAYLGDSKRTTSSEVVSSTDTTPARTTVNTVEKMDRYGRIWYLTEPNGTVTAYGYGVTGALARVCMNATLTGGVLSTASCGQERKFAYDNRGFMTSETHPENGAIAYTYDAAGHVLTKRPSTTNTIFDLNYSYDDAERLKEVDSWYPAGSIFRPDKVFTFGQDNDGVNLKRGKLETATRHNYRPPTGATSDVRIVETYSYKDDAGRLTERSTEIKDVINGSGVNETFYQSQSYSTLGMPSLVGYPYCQSGGTAMCGATSSGSLSLVRTNGWLSAFAKVGVSYGESITYHPSGMIDTITHGNGVADAQTPDSYGLPRPQSITFSSFGSCTVPAIAALPDYTIQSGHTQTFFANASGTGTLTYEWFQEGTAVPDSNSPYYSTPTLTSTRHYFVRVANSCGVTQSNTATVTVAPILSAPTGLYAFMLPTTSVQVSWNGVTGAQHYEIWRRDPSGAVNKVGESTISGYVDPSASSNTAYLYKACASPTAGIGCTSPFSNQDLATTVAFRDIPSDARIYFRDVDDILTAVNAVRSAAGMTSITWLQIAQNYGVPQAERGSLVYGAHMMALRFYMEDALNHLLGTSGFNYTNPILPGSQAVYIKAVHITELRGRVQ